MTAGAAEQLVLVGAGGFGRETAELARSITVDGRPRWEVAFLDDERAKHGTRISGVEVIGAIDHVHELPDARVVLCTGHPGNYRSKQRIAERLGLAPERYATLVHPTAVIAPSCTLGPGTVVHAGVVTTADVCIGAHVGIMPLVVCTHDDVLEDFVTVGAGVRFAGTVHVGTGAYVGSGALIRENRTIGPWALVGMGAVVTRDVPGGEIWAGVPARHVGTAP